MLIDILMRILIVYRVMIEDMICFYQFLYFILLNKLKWLKDMIFLKIGVKILKFN